jgi:hypothetical protein
MLKKTFPFLAGLALVLASPPAQATPLPPGGRVDNPPLPGLATPKVVASMSVAFSFPSDLGTTAGVFRAEVVTENHGRQFDFFYQVSLSSGALLRFGDTSFNRLKTDVFQYSNGFGLAGNIFQNGAVKVTEDTRVSTDADHIGDFIAFDFFDNGRAPPLPGGKTSFVQIVKTNVDGFDRDGMVLLVGKGGAVRLPGILEPRIVPEPSSLAELLGVTVPVLGGYLWRRRANNELGHRLAAPSAESEAT